MDYMKDVLDKYFDLAIVDPPYGIGISNVENIGYGDAIDYRNGKKMNCKRNKWKIKEWDNHKPSIEYFNELQRISKNQIIWGINYFTGYLNFPSSGRLIWEKSPDLHQYYEIAGLTQIKNIILFRYYWNGVLQGKSASEGHLRQGDYKLYEKRIHPTQKPVILHKWLLKNYAEPKFKIIDTHLGSGSSAIAAHDFGIADFVGCEIDKDYFDASVKRIQNHVKQLDMFQKRPEIIINEI